MRTIGSQAPPYILLAYTITVFSFLVRLLHRYKDEFEMLRARRTIRKIKIFLIPSRIGIYVDTVIWIGLLYSLITHLLCLARITFCKAMILDKIILLSLWVLPLLMIFYLLNIDRIQRTKIHQILELFKKE